MRVQSIVHRLIGKCGSKLHAKRYAVLVEAVVGLLRVQQLSLTTVGRALAGKAKLKHAVKRMDRLLGNPRMWREATHVYAAMMSTLLRGIGRVVVAIDWTQLPNELYALTAAVVFRGRALPVFSLVRPQSELGSPGAHEAFLDGLRRVLPHRCEAILVADAGFKTPFFEACAARGFDFVVRLRGKGVTETWDFDSDGSDARLRFQQLFARASERAQCMGQRVPYASTRTNSHRIVLGPQPKQRRKRRGDEPKNAYRRRALEAWLLVTSLHNEPAEQVVRLYATRMQIEETFRDTKDPRFGWALDYSRTRCPQRFSVLLLIASIASAVVASVGATAELCGRSRELQANTERRRRVLSLHRIGSILVQRGHRVCCKLRSLQRELRAFHRLLTQRPRAPIRGLSLPLHHDLFCADCGTNFARYGWPC